MEPTCDSGDIIWCARLFLSVWIVWHSKPVRSAHSARMQVQEPKVALNRVEPGTSERLFLVTGLRLR